MSNSMCGQAGTDPFLREGSKVYGVPILHHQRIESIFLCILIEERSNVLTIFPMILFYMRFRYWRRETEKEGIRTSRCHAVRYVTRKIERDLREGIAEHVP